MKCRVTTLVLLLIAGALVSPAKAQHDLEKRLDRIEFQMRVLKGRPNVERMLMARGVRPSSDSYSFVDRFAVEPPRPSPAYLNFLVNCDPRTTNLHIVNGWVDAQDVWNEISRRSDILGMGPRRPEWDAMRNGMRMWNRAGIKNRFRMYARMRNEGYPIRTMD